MVDDGESNNFITLASSDSSAEEEDDEEGKMITIIPKSKPNITSILDTAEPNIATSDIVKQNEFPIGDIVPRKPGIRNVAKWKTVDRKTVHQSGKQYISRRNKIVPEKKMKTTKGLHCKLQISM